jgi:hypothetical protein
MTLSPMPNLPQQEARRRWVDDLLAIIAIQAEELHRLREEKQALRDAGDSAQSTKGKAVDQSVSPDPQGPKGQSMEAISPGQQ